MRKDVQKMLFVGAAEVKDRFFEGAQQLGMIHFIDAQQKRSKELPKEMQQISAAIKVLRELPSMRQEELASLSSADRLADKIVQLHSRLSQLEEEQRLVKLEIARVEPFGEFDQRSLDEALKKGGKVCQYFWTKADHYHKDKELPEGLIFISSANGLDYYMAINTLRRQYEGAFEMSIEEPLQLLREKLKSSHATHHQIDTELKTYQKYSDYLHKALIDKFNSFDLHLKQEYVSRPMEGQLFAVEGWVPADKTEALKPLLDQMGVYCEKIAIDEAETIPTYLENEGWSKVGEDLVGIYDTPSHTDKDPSLWVLASFALFFAMIVGDGGYGLLFLVFALYIGYRHQKMNSLGTRMWKLAVLLSFSCIAWGLMTNSFFGVSLAPDNPLMKFSLLNWLVTKKAAYHMHKQDAVYQEWAERYPVIAGMDDPKSALLAASDVSPGGSHSYAMYASFADSIMMELALFVGIVHVLLSIMRYLGRNPTGVGWIAFILGCYLYFPEYLDGTTFLQYVFGVDRARAAAESIYLIAGGATAAIFISVVMNKLLGLLEVATAIQIFADILSYLRLYALAMAGAIVSATINDFAATAGIVGAFLLIAAGHLFNIVLSVMGGVIHGLRLNFLEWYHYSFGGGGTPFKPLKKIVLE